MQEGGQEEEEEEEEGEGEEEETFHGLSAILSVLSMLGTKRETNAENCSHSSRR